VEQRLGVDYGLKRIGLALGSIVAKEHSTIANDDKAVANTVQITRDEGVDTLVIGDPIRSQGEAGTIKGEIEKFVHDVKTDVPHLSVKYVNEAYSSSQAMSELTHAGVKHEDAEARVDQYAAKIILDQFNNENEIGLWSI